MRVLSIWQPWASLIIAGHKRIETRSWPCPASLVGERIGIAATKSLRKEQREAVNDPAFSTAYVQSKLPDFQGLPRGALLGTILIVGSEPITPDLVHALSPSELAFGIYTEGRHAWRLADPVLFETPIPVSGRQGIWILHDSTITQAEAQARTPAPGPALRGALHDAHG